MGASRFARRLGTLVQDWIWWLAIGPFCVASQLPALGISPRRPLRLSGEPDQYPVTELLGRVMTIRGRLRLARALLILIRTLVLVGIILLAGRLVEFITHESLAFWVILGVFLVAGWGLHLALHHSIPLFEVARIVDRQLGLDAQIATAVENTLNDHLDRPFSRTQIRLATNRLREVDTTAAVPLVWPSRDVRLLASVVVALGITSAIGSMGWNLPRQVQPIDAELAKQAGKEAQAPSPFIQMNAAQVPFVTGTTPLSPAQLPNSALNQQLSTLQQQLANQAISPEQYQQGLQQVQQQIRQQAQQSLAAQDSLNALAAALKDASSTQAISNSLNQGDAQKAAAQLGELSKQLPQLSPQARQDLAQHLQQAAQQTSNLSSGISQSSQQAADALNQGNTQAAAQAMQDLAKAVQQAGQQVNGQSQLGQEARDVRQQLGDRGQQANQDQANGDQSNANQSGQANQGSQSNQASQSGSNGDQNGQGSQANQSATNPNGSGDHPGAEQAQAGEQGDAGTADSNRGAVKSSASSQIQNAQSDNSGGVGNAPGGNPLSGSPQTLDTHGVKVTIVGQPSGPGSSSTQAGDRNDPLTAPDGGSLATAGSSGAPPSDVPINVHQEGNDVPVGLKPVVRDYFTNDSGDGN